MAPIITQFSDSLVSDYPSGNQWYLNGGAIPGAIGVYWVAQVSGDYFVSHTDSLGCEVFSDTLNMNLLSQRETWIDPVSIWPNPVNNILSVEWEGAKSSWNKFCLFDLSGKAIGKWTEVSGQKIEISLGGLQPGVYFLRIKTGTGILQRKFVKL